MTTDRFIVFKMGDGTRFITTCYTYEEGGTSHRPAIVEMGATLFALEMTLMYPSGDPG